MALAEMVAEDVMISREHCEKLAELAEDRVVDVRLMAARCHARGFKPGKQFTVQRIREITASLFSLFTDDSQSVRDELRGLDWDMLAEWREQNGAGTALHEQSSDSSDDEDDVSPQSDHRTSDAAKILPGPYRAVNGGETSETTQKSSSTYTTGYSTNPSGAADTQHEDSDDDDDDDEVEDVDLESSTIYEIDLEDLASSTTQLPKIQDSFQSLRRDTPPLRANSKLSTSPLPASRLASTPPSSNRPCQLERPSSASSWHFSMRDEEQYVTIDVTGHA